MRSWRGWKEQCKSRRGGGRGGAGHAPALESGGSTSKGDQCWPRHGRPVKPSQRYVCMCVSSAPSSSADMRRLPNLALIHIYVLSRCPPWVERLACQKKSPTQSADTRLPSGMSESFTRGGLSPAAAAALITSRGANEVHQRAHSPATRDARHGRPRRRRGVHRRRARRAAA